MKSACSSKGDGARQRAVGLRKIAVFCDEMQFLSALDKTHSEYVGSGQGFLFAIVADRP